MSLKSVFQRKSRNYDSDSTGYSSSSDVSSPLSGSQFILRPATGQSICSDQSLYHTLEYEQYPTSSNYTSPSSSLSTSENVSLIVFSNKSTPLELQYQAQLY
ncbi:hypothetical protein Y032_0050g1941 [Ancylostoma ceylanicum]|uniref:Uncharacterized protein n=1 Tax=Ancylostoma ceylanicum TaxID=53326 RepID=A0A016U9A4_9BILA|nr:hypothetical protein Y032_0050g1941 [Ancylostoma ceylanicum]